MLGGCATSEIKVMCLLDLLKIVHVPTMIFVKILKNCTSAVMEAVKIAFCDNPQMHNLHDGQLYNLLDLILLSGPPGYPKAI